MHAILDNLPQRMTGPVTWSFSMTIELPSGVELELHDRFTAAARRLQRGAVCSKWKARKLAQGLEAIATLFDGVR